MSLLWAFSSSGERKLFLCVDPILSPSQFLFEVVELCLKLEVLGLPTLLGRQPWNLFSPGRDFWLFISKCISKEVKVHSDLWTWNFFFFFWIWGFRLAHLSFLEEYGSNATGRKLVRDFEGHPSSTLGN